MIVYDSEIKKAILKKGERAVPNIEYCKGFEDYANMGISVIVVFDYSDGRYKIFCDDNRDAFHELVNRHDIIVGFNSRKFDNNLVLHTWGFKIPEEKTYDILEEMWRADGLSVPAPGGFFPREYWGYGLDPTVQANFPKMMGKTADGALAPVLWQQGKVGQVIDYCANDVAMTVALLDKICVKGGLISPKQHSTILKIDPPKAPRPYIIAVGDDYEEPTDDLFSGKQSDLDESEVAPAFDPATPAPDGPGKSDHEE